MNGDGWEPGPNPVAQIIAVRTLQTGGVALATLAGLSAVLPSERFLPVVAGGGAVVTLGLSAYFVATFSPRTRFVNGGAFWTCLPPEYPVNTVALTFDDGPHPETTPRLLDRLAEADLKATFFLVGERAASYPHLARRVADEGHTLGVHGLRHRTMVLQSGTQIAADLREAQARIENATGKPLEKRLLRPPYGFKTWTLARTAKQEGWTLVGWSCDPRDYDGVPAEIVARRVEEQVRPRDILLLHERPGEPSAGDGLVEIAAGLRLRNLISVAL